MRVWISKAKKKRKCSYCPEEIVAGSYIVVATYTFSGKWKKMLAWHTQCWIQQGINAVDSKPVDDRRGGNRLVISPEDKERRHKVLMRRTAVVQRIRAVMEIPADAKSVDKIIHLGEMLNSLEEEILLLGGVPKSWK